LQIFICKNCFANIYFLCKHIGFFCKRLQIIFTTFAAKLASRCP
jgi:hypothetical protein